MFWYKKLNNKYLAAFSAAGNFFLLCVFFFVFSADLLPSSVLCSAQNTGEASFPAIAPLAAACLVGESEPRLPAEHDSRKQFTTINKEMLENTQILRNFDQGILAAEKVLNELPQRKDFSVFMQIAFGNANLKSDSFKSHLFNFQ